MVSRINSVKLEISHRHPLKIHTLYFCHMTSDGQVCTSVSDALCTFNSIKSVVSRFLPAELEDNSILLKNKAPLPRLYPRGQILSELTPEVGGQSPRRDCPVQNTGTRKGRCHRFRTHSFLKAPTQHMELDSVFGTCEPPWVVTFSWTLGSGRHIGDLLPICVVHI